MSSSVTEVLNNYDVYHGVWTNWEKGSVRGATLTTTTKHGALLIAFLALYVQIVGSRFWRILSFAFHQTLSSPTARDGFYHQRQSVLRNVGTDYSSLFEFLRIGWAWRGKTRMPLRRVLPLCIAALIHIGLFTVAGIFSSYVTDAQGNEVLLLNTRGGFLNGTNLQDFGTEADELMYAIPYSTELTIASSTYAQQCYNANASSQACETYVKANVQSTQKNISCPFGGNICIDGTGISIDSGLLDSQIDFGINSRPEDRFQWRAVTTCAVITTEGYMETVHDTDFNLTEYPRVLLNYGPVIQDANNDTTNYTRAWSTALSRQLPLMFRDYVLKAEGYNTGVPSSWNSWTPIPEITASDADTFIYFLSSSSLAFVSPVDDPWYSAHTLNNDTGYYSLDRPVNPLVCQTQYQYCNPNNAQYPDGGCALLDGMYPATNATTNTTFWSSTAQMQSASLFAMVNTGFVDLDIGQIVANLGSSALLARNSMSAGDQSPLPRNQWQLEVRHWHDSMLAMLQRLVVEQAAGPSDAGVEQYIQAVDYANPVVSQPQIIRSPAYTSFSVLGMSFIIGVGTFIILISFTIEPLVGHFQRHNSFPLLSMSRSYSNSPESVRHQYRRAEWLTDQKFQLQRIAFEGAGSGRWTGALDMVPTTVEPGKKLPRLDLRDHGHPRLRALEKEMGGVAVVGLKGGFGSRGFDSNDGARDTDISSTAKLQLNTFTGRPQTYTTNDIKQGYIYSSYASPGLSDEDTTYAGSLGLPTPGLETPGSLRLGPLRSESWRGGFGDREREHLVRHDTGMGFGQVERRGDGNGDGNQMPYRDVTRNSVGG